MWGCNDTRDYIKNISIKLNVYNTTIGLTYQFILYNYGNTFENSRNHSGRRSVSVFQFDRI